MGRIIDITHYLDNTLEVWPGDTKVEITHTREVGRNSRSTVSRLVLGSHAGTHMDAPAHFIENGKNIDELDLNVLIGECVLAETDADRISRSVLEQLGVPEGTERLLLKTTNSTRFSGVEPFFKDYSGLTMSGAEWIVERGLRLVGLDYMSIAVHPEIGEVHRLLLGEEVVLLETLDLRAAAPGFYQLTALPLKLRHTEGSPVRAVLVQHPKS